MGTSKRACKEKVKEHGEMIGLVYSADPGEEERFFKRMLLDMSSDEQITRYPYTP